MMIWTGTGVLIPDLQTDTLRSRPEENMFLGNCPETEKNGSVQISYWKMPQKYPTLRNWIHKNSLVKQFDFWVKIMLKAFDDLN